MGGFPTVLRRIAVLGSAGAGKSTLAVEMGRLLGLPVVHLDRVFWRPGWVEPTREEWIEDHRALLDAAEWILDGNYGSTMEERLAAAQAAVFNDFGRLRCLWRVTARSLRYFGRERPDLDPGCREKLLPDREFVDWIWKFPRKSRPVILDHLAAFERRGGHVTRLASPREVGRFLVGLRRAVK